MKPSGNRPPSGALAALLSLLAVVFQPGIALAGASIDVACGVELSCCCEPEAHAEVEALEAGCCEQESTPVVLVEPPCSCRGVPARSPMQPSTPLGPEQARDASPLDRLLTLAEHEAHAQLDLPGAAPSGCAHAPPPDTRAVHERPPGGGAGTWSLITRGSPGFLAFLSVARL